MYSRKSVWRAVVSMACLIVLAFGSLAQRAYAANAMVVINSTPNIVKQAQNLGPEDPSKRISVTLWLHQQNEAALDQLVQDLYTEGSPNYHHFLTWSEYASRFAPGSQAAHQVAEFLRSKNLNVVSTDNYNHFVTAEGTVADVQSAFQVQINRFQYNGKTFRSNNSDATLSGAAASLVKAVTGLHDLKFEPDHLAPTDPETGKALPPIPLKAGAPNGMFYAGYCFRPPETVTFTTGGGNPTALYTGNRYGTEPGTPPPNAPPCGYDPYEMQVAYKLRSLYAAGWSGQGQTVVIVDAFGSPTIQTDAMTFSTLYGLPLPNLTIYTPTGPTTYDPGWATETTIDVEWSHSVAPLAKLALVAAADANFTTLNMGVLYAIENGLGNVISNSYGIPEVALIGDANDLLVTSSLNQVAAVLGISTNYSTGDSGDNFAGTGYLSAGFPATDVYATAVGGVSVFLNTDDSIKFQTAWGNNYTRITDYPPNPPLVPPTNLGNIGGSGGGPSIFWKKPAYQKALSGGFRQTPDVSWVADPYTGVEIIITPDGIPGHAKQVQVWGGTSVACPMFSGLWAIANQAAGSKAPLGNAAPYMYKLTGNAIHDIVEITSPTNVKGWIYNPPAPPAFESPTALSAPLDGTGKFVNALYHNPFSLRWYVLTFGTDTSLHAGPGWDNATGVGSPNGWFFVQQVAK